MTEEKEKIVYRVEFETGDVMHTEDKKLAELHLQKGRLVSPEPSE